MHIEAYASIKERHSFHCDVKTRFWAEYDTVGELVAILRDAAGFGMPILPVGAGCNLLFRNDYPGILLHSNISGIDEVEKTEDYATVRVGSGVVWDDFVSWCVDRQLCGVENLSGIPGQAGAVPVQNIGAYGMEAADVIERVEVLDRDTLKVQEVSADECRLGYRDSRFKHDWKDRYVVVNVFFRLQPLQEGYLYRLDYGQLKDRVETLTGGHPTLKAVRQCVLEIRSAKLPDPAILGNAGSFFKNPVLPGSVFEALKAEFPDIPFWPLADGQVKIPAAWLIERSGWKGKSLGRAGCYEKQPLVLVNHGGASGEEICTLFERIAADVMTLSGVALQPEAVIIQDEI